MSNCNDLERVLVEKAVKKCFKCENMLSLDEFYQHPQMADGHLNKCKVCTKEDVSQNYTQRRKQYSEYDRRRGHNSERKRKKQEYKKRYRERHPEKYQAEIIVGNAIRDGKLIKQPCCICGVTESVQAHHNDYSKPLDVEWLCFQCHREKRHGQIVTRRIT